MSVKYILQVKVDSDYPSLKKYYQNYKCNDDSGIDLIIPNDIYPIKGQVTDINHKISCQLCKYVDNKLIGYVGYWLLPRSSISKTKFRLANSVGLIDSGYRGNIIAKIDTLPNNNEIILTDKKLFQIAAPDLTPISQILVVDKLSQTNRGDNGFGSTDNIEN